MEVEKETLKQTIARLIKQRESLLLQVKKLKLSGNMMSNVLYNYAQNSGKIIGPEDCKIMDDLRKKWDAVREECNG